MSGLMFVSFAVGTIGIIALILNGFTFWISAMYTILSHTSLTLMVRPNVSIFLGTLVHHHMVVLDALLLRDVFFEGLVLIIFDRRWFLSQLVRELELWNFHLFPVRD